MQEVRFRKVHTALKANLAVAEVKAMLYQLMDDLEMELRYALPFNPLLSLLIHTLAVTYLIYPSLSGSLKLTHFYASVGQLEFVHTM